MEHSTDLKLERAGTTPFKIKIASRGNEQSSNTIFIQNQTSFQTNLGSQGVHVDVEVLLAVLLEVMLPKVPPGAETFAQRANHSRTAVGLGSFAPGHVPLVCPVIALRAKDTLRNVDPQPFHTSVSPEADRTVVL